jgi:CBS domain containing-hemolysin-like protein
LADLLTYAFLALGVVTSFGVSLIEATYLIVKPVSLFTASRDGSRNAGLALKITEQRNKLISVTTFMDTVANVLVVTTLALLLSEAFGALGWVIGVVFGSLLIMIFLYLVPKTMGIDNPVRMATALAPLTSFLIRLLAPVAIPLTNLASAISQGIFGKPAYSQTQLVDEFEDFIDMLEDAGHIGPDMGRIFRSTLASSHSDAMSVGTSVEKLVSVDTDATIIEALRLMGDSLHPRLPVYDRANGQFVGAVTFRSLMPGISSRTLSDRVNKYLIQAARVEAGDSLPSVIEKMNGLGTSVAFVYTENRMIAVITLTDILESLLGLRVK